MPYLCQEGSGAVKNWLPFWLPEPTRKGDRHGLGAPMGHKTRDAPVKTLYLENSQPRGRDEPQGNAR